MSLTYTPCSSSEVLAFLYQCPSIFTLPFKKIKVDAEELLFGKSPTARPQREALSVDDFLVVKENPSFYGTNQRTGQPLPEACIWYLFRKK